jgi:hypothetical protein
MKIGILPYELRHEKNLAAIPLRSLTWPSQDADTGEPVGCIGDLSAHDHVVVYPSSTRLLRGFGGVSCKVNLLMAEPLAIQRRYYQSIWLLRHKFNAIFCRYGYYAWRYSNVHQLAVVESWVDGHAVNLTLGKPHYCSIIASAKQDLTGHKLRHALVAWVRQVANPPLRVQVLGRGYDPFEHKQDGLLPYWYSVVIENVQEVDYFTEKLLDCMLCGTLPIYWGAPNIEEYFDVAGMIICNSLTDLQQAVGRVGGFSQAIPTASQCLAMELNRKVALDLSLLPPRLVEIIVKQESQCQ